MPGVPPPPVPPKKRISVSEDPAEQKPSEWLQRPQYVNMSQTQKQSWQWLWREKGQSQECVLQLCGQMQVQEKAGVIEQAEYLQSLPRLNYCIPAGYLYGV